MPVIQPGNLQRGQSNYLPYIPLPSAYIAESMLYQTAIPLQFTLIKEVAATTTDYAEIDVLGRNLHAIAVSASGIYNATVLVEATLDGVNWGMLDSITATGIKQYSGLYQSIRISIPTYTSGTITVSAITQRS